jgi:hypothetical protein
MIYSFWLLLWYFQTFLNVVVSRWIPQTGVITNLSQVIDKLYCIMLYRVNLTWAGSKLTTLVVISTDCKGSWKSNGKCLRQAKHIRGHLLNISKNYKYYLFFPKAVIIPLTWFVIQRVPTGAPEIIPGFCGVRVTRSLVLCIMFCLSLFVLDRMGKKCYWWDFAHILYNLCKILLLNIWK